MKTNSRLPIAVIGLLFALLIPAYATPTTKQELASVNYLVGTWNCDHTVGDFAGKYRTTYSKALGDMWLKQTYDFPATTTAGQQEPAITAETLIGYDERRQAWVRFFANSKGQYFAIRMNDTGSGWSWKYVSFFKRMTPETPDPDATLTKKSNTEYVIDGPSYQLNGTRVTEHHMCEKM